MPGVPPLSTLLSQALIAFTIEFDNEFEHRMPHSTTNHRSAAGPWLTSLVMWSTCMRFVSPAGIRVGELEHLALTKTNLNGMQRWRYIDIEQTPPGDRKKLPRDAWVIRATPPGRRAQEIWAPLSGVIEQRWQERFGQPEIAALRQSLWALIRQFKIELPDCLPILGYGLFSKGPLHKRPPAPVPAEDISGAPLTLPALLARPLLALAIKFERQSHLSLPIAANLLRVLHENGVRLRDLPHLSGVSKEAIQMALGILQKRHFVTLAPNPTALRTKLLRLTPAGREAQDAYCPLLHAIEENWQARFGKTVILTLRKSLEPFSDEPLFRGLVPYPEGWRASLPKPDTLPHFPMVLHRGGYPDGS